MKCRVEIDYEVVHCRGAGLNENRSCSFMAGSEAEAIEMLHSKERFSKINIKNVSTTYIPQLSEIIREHRGVVYVR